MFLPYLHQFWTIFYDPRLVLKQKHVGYIIYPCVLRLSVHSFDPFCKCICFRNITNEVPLNMGYNILYIEYIELIPEKTGGVQCSAAAVYI